MAHSPLRSEFVYGDSSTSQSPDISIDTRISTLGGALRNCVLRLGLIDFFLMDLLATAGDVAPQQTECYSLMSA